jgi:hypothetical protein
MDMYLCMFEKRTKALYKVCMHHGTIFTLQYSCEHEYSCEHGAQMTFGDLTPYLTYGTREKGRTQVPRQYGVLCSTVG